MGASSPAMVVDLVERFEKDRKVFLSSDYEEAQLRASTQASCLEPRLPEGQSLT